MVTFSSVNLKTLTECGQQKAFPDSTGESIFLEKRINLTEWEYSTKNYSVNPKYKKQIFIDCSDAHGDGIYQASGIYINSEKDREIEDAKLISKLIFSVREFKDFLYRKNVQGIKKGTVHVYLSAIHPVECLLFAFEKVLGFSVEKEELYQDFINKVFCNAVLMGTQKWLNMYGWTVKLEYCSLQQIYVNEIKVLTEYGKRMKNYREMEALRDVLKGPNDSFVREYRASDSLRYEPHASNYKKLLADWKAKGGLTRKGSGVVGYGGDFVNMDYPAIEYAGARRTYGQFCALIEKADSEEKRRLKESQEMDAMKKRRDELKAQADKEEANLRADEKRFQQGRGAEINSKLQELEERKKVKSDPTTFWNVRYDQDYAPEGGMNTFEYDLQKNEERELIEFEGNLVDEEDLREKINEVNNDHYKRKKEIEKLRQAVDQLQDNIDDIFWDRIFTGIQLTLAVACMIAAPYASPLIAVAVLGVGAAVVDIGIEVTKWIVIDDTWDEHLAAHLTTIGLDIAFAAFGPLFKKIVGKIAVNMVGKEIAATEKSLASSRQAYKAADSAATNAEIDAVISAIGNKEAKAAADAEAAAARAEATAARAEADAAMKEANLARDEASKLSRKLTLTSNAEIESQIFARWEKAESEATNKFIVALEKDTAAIQKETKATGAEMVAASKDESRILIDAKISRAKADGIKREISQGEQRLKDLHTQQEWLKNYSNPLKEAANPTVNTAVNAGKEKVFTGITKIFGYDTIVDLNKALKYVETGYANTNKTIQLSRTGFFWVNTGMNVGKFINLGINGYAYVKDDWVKVDYTEGVDKTVLKPAN